MISPLDIQRLALQKNKWNLKKPKLANIKDSVKPRKCPPGKKVLIEHTLSPIAHAKMLRCKHQVSHGNLVEIGYLRGRRAGPEEQLLFRSQDKTAANLGHL